jgi:glycosyltransferase involved in cell wall biosynthesis
VILRGHQANPWELRPWQEPALADRFDVSYLRSSRGWFDASSLTLRGERARTLRDLLPPGRLGDLAVRLPGDRYLGLARSLRGADIVHTQELGYWYSMQAAKLKRALGFRMVTTVWETIPFLGAYRNFRTRPYRELTLQETDLFLAATERAKISLLLEGAAEDRIRVCPPGIETDRFCVSAGPAGAHDDSSSARPIVISPGRLVWEKGHQDVMRAVALLRRGIAGGEPLEVSLCIVGTGPEERRLRTYARELGIADLLELRGFIPYEEMPQTYHRASCMVLASLPTWSWEEQFGMVLAEAMAAGLPILASSSGAIPEVTGAAARHFMPGDWPDLASCIADAVRGKVRPSLVSGRNYSVEDAAERLAGAYEELLGCRGGAARLPASSAS